MRDENDPRHVRSFVDVARMAEGWGFLFDLGASREEIIRTTKGGLPWDGVDKGNLTRIAVAAESISNRLAVVVRELCAISRQLDPVWQQKRLRELEKEAAEKAEREEQRRQKLEAVGGEAALLDKSLSELHALTGKAFPARLMTIFEIEDIRTFRQLCIRTSDDLLELRNFGTGSLHEVKNALASLGLSLADDGA